MNDEHKVVVRFKIISNKIGILISQACFPTIFPVQFRLQKGRALSEFRAAEILLALQAGVLFLQPLVVVIQNFIQVSRILNYAVYFGDLAFGTLVKIFTELAILSLVFILNNFYLDVAIVQFG